MYIVKIVVNLLVNLYLIRFYDKTMSFIAVTLYRVRILSEIRMNYYGNVSVEIQLIIYSSKKVFTRELLSETYFIKYLILTI